MTTTDLEQRLSIPDVDSAAYQPLLTMEQYLHDGVLSEALLSLIKLRASQINGCAFCLDMHAEEARKAGVSQRNLDVLAGWREAPSLFTEREQAALKLTEEVTLIGQAGVSDATWAAVAAVYSSTETVKLLLAICAINTWNRLAIATHQALPQRS